MLAVAFMLWIRTYGQVSAKWTWTTLPLSGCVWGGSCFLRSVQHECLVLDEEREDYSKVAPIPNWAAGHWIRSSNKGLNHKP